MITLALSTVLCCAAQAVEVAARLELAPGATAATGQPLEWTVTVSGLDSDSAVLAAPPDFGPEWVVLGGPTPVVNSDLALASRPGLELRWALMAAKHLKTHLQTPPPASTEGVGRCLFLAIARMTSSRLASCLAVTHNLPSESSPRVSIPENSGCARALARGSSRS